MGRGVLAKAMVVSHRQGHGGRMYDKVQKHWKACLAELRKEAAAADPMDKPELEARLKFIEETDMAVVVSQRRTRSKSSRRRAWTSPRTASGW